MFEEGELVGGVEGVVVRETRVLDHDAPQLDGQTGRMGGVVVHWRVWFPAKTRLVSQ